LLEVRQAPGRAYRQREALELEDSSHLKDFIAMVRQWLVTELGLDIAYKHHQLVRYQLKAKLKVPRTQSLKQHPESQSHFKTRAQILAGGIWESAEVLMPRRNSVGTPKQLRDV